MRFGSTARIGFADVTVSADFEHGKAPTHAKQTFAYEAVRR